MLDTHNKTDQKLLVQIPNTEHFIDVQPFINFIFSDFDNPEHAIKYCQTDIDKRIRFIATELALSTCRENRAQIVDLFTNLYKLKDLFSATSILTKKED